MVKPKNSEGGEIRLSTTTSNEEHEAIGFFPAHVKIALNRFIDRDPHESELISMRESFPVAPKELVRINSKLNDAINRGWKHLRRKEYKVLDETSYNAMFEEAAGPFDEEWIAEQQNKYIANANEDYERK